MIARIGVALFLAFSLLFTSGCGISSGKWYVQANKHLESGHDAKADKVIEQGIRQSSDKFHAVMMASAVYEHNRRLAAQVRLLDGFVESPDKVIGRDLTDIEKASVWHSLSFVYERLGVTDRAIAALEQADRLMPDSDDRVVFDKANGVVLDRSVLENNLAYFYADNDRQLQKALTLAQKAYAVNKDHTIADTLGWVNYKLGNYSEALHLLKVAVDQNPGEPAYRYHLAMVYIKTNEPDRARIELEKTLILDPAMIDARKQLTYLEQSG